MKKPQIKTVESSASNTTLTFTVPQSPTIRASLRTSDGALIPFLSIGANETWPNGWASFGQLWKGSFSLEIEVKNAPGESHFVYQSNHLERVDGKPAFRNLLSQGSVHSYKTRFVITHERDIPADRNNMAVVVVGETKFDTYEVSVQGTKDGKVYLVVQRTWHGHLFQKKDGGIIIPRLNRKNISYPPLFVHLALRYSPDKLPLYTDGVLLTEHFEEHLRYSELTTDQLVVIAMAPTGGFFMRDREGRHVVGHINKVVEFVDCPVPTVGTICKADVTEDRGLRKASRIVFLASRVSEKIFFETLMTSDMRRLVDLEAVSVEVKPVVLVKIQSRQSVRRDSKPLPAWENEDPAHLEEIFFPRV